MRVNVYGEELTDRVEYVSKEVDGITFHGVRFWLKFPNQPWWEHRPGDDDSDALTIWHRDREALAGLLKKAKEEVEA